MSTGTFKKSVSNSEGGNYEIPEAGPYPAVLVGLIGLGTQEETFEGETKSSEKILLAWELVSEFDSNGSPFILGQSYTWSLSPKAKLRPVVEGMIGRTLQDREEFDLESLVGKPCTLNVTHGMTKAGKEYAKIGGASKPMKGMATPEPSTTPFKFNVKGETSSAGEPEIPAWVPFIYGQKPADVIKRSAEWRNLPAF